MATKETRERKIEQFHLLAFANTLPGFPAGRLIMGDKPDLIVENENGNLGIEHTRLFRVEGRTDKVIPQAQERLRNQVMDAARAIFEQRGGGMLQVNAFFNRSDENALTKSSVEEIATRLVDVVTLMIKLEGQSFYDGRLRIAEQWSCDLRFPGLFPRQIDSVNFNAIDRPGFVIWGVPDGICAPNITEEYLQQKIDTKNSKVDTYLNRCSKVWLLMVADNGACSSYFNITKEVAEATYYTRFNRIFYFGRMDSEIVELQINENLR